MLFSFFSIFFSYNLIFLRNKNINFFYEDLHLIIYFLIIITIFFLFFSFNNDFSIEVISRCAEPPFGAERPFGAEVAMYKA